MRITPDRRRPTRSGPAGWFWTVSPWMWALAVLVIALAFNVPAAPTVLFVIVTVVGAVATAGSKRIQEWFERKPDLGVVAVCADELLTTVESDILRPWPFDLDLVVAHEIQRLREATDARDRMARRPGPFALYRSSPFATRPSAGSHDRAREEFDEEIEAHATRLTKWLRDYREAADAQGRTFELDLAVTSAKRGAYAEDVSLIIDLPEGVEIVEEWPSIAPPPEPPTYMPPRPRDPFDIARPSYADIGVRALAPIIPAIAIPHVLRWQTHTDGRRVGMGLGNIHHDSTAELGEPLLLRVPGAGRYGLSWTLRTKNGRRHRTGTLDLVVPEGPERAPFKKLKGMMEFLDVPWVDDDGEQIKPARRADPPTSAPARETDSLTARLRSARARSDWFDLGLAEEDEDAGDVLEDDDWPEVLDLDAIVDETADERAS